MTENEIGEVVVDAATVIYKELDPLLFEIVYEVLINS